MSATVDLQQGKIGAGRNQVLAGSVTGGSGPFVWISVKKWRPSGKSLIFMNFL